MLPIRDNSTRGRRAYIFSIILLVTIGLTLISGLWQLYVIHLFNNGEADISYLELTDQVQRVMYFIHIPVLLTYIIIFIQWFRRAYYNLHQINPGYATHSEGWAAGGWFVPFLNLVRPVKIMKEIWNGTLSVLQGRVNVEEPANLIGVWWGAYIISNLCNRIAYQLARRTGNLDDYTTSLLFDIAGDITGIVALTMLFVVIKQFMAIEARLPELDLIPEDSIFYIPQHSGEEIAANEANS